MPPHLEDIECGARYEGAAGSGREPGPRAMRTRQVSDLPNPPCRFLEVAERCRIGQRPRVVE